MCRSTDLAGLQALYLSIERSESKDPRSSDFKANGAACCGAGDSEIPDDKSQPGSKLCNVGAVGAGGEYFSS